MNSNDVPIGFGFALSSCTAAMNHYAHLPEERKQEILQKARNTRSDKEMYDLVASLANNQLK